MLHLPEVFEAAPGRLRFDGPTLDGYELQLPERAAYRRAPRAARSESKRAPEPSPVYALELAVPAPLPLMAADEHDSDAGEALELRRSRLPEPIH